MVGLETAVSLCLDRLVHAGVIALPRMVELFTTGPARRPAPGQGDASRSGSDADMTVLDLERRVAVDARRVRVEEPQHAVRRLALRGAPVLTIVAGEGDP